MLSAKNGNGREANVAKTNRAGRHFLSLKAKKNFADGASVLEMSQKYKLKNFQESQILVTSENKISYH